ncbi:hypothetical protein LNKW23_37000 [Paralimibaculum aggregatum]|uniref:Uncharacterized protein n=1 Tax=Paralimibaculum aggregatum TaxID=3036245 RepID=A0ABQ6LMN8_9RHOB|nr:hypothetical protein [Limibaculum sp. NKW23]GMG84484.1 hypothetical protein LNKW23_37000 [Limibaculum sp. NKW23]
MATKLTDSNIEKIKKEIRVKGFRTKFWREYRAGACRGNGVAKELDKLEKLGLPQSGDPSKAPIENMSEIVFALTDLEGAIYRASTKCGRLQKHSKEFCLEYKKFIQRYYKVAQKLANGGGGELIAEVKAERRELERQKREEEARRREEAERERKEIAASKKKTEEELVKKVEKDETPEEIARVRDKLEHSIMMLKEIPAETDAVALNAQKARREIDRLMTAWEGGRDKPEVSVGKLDKAVAVAVQKTAPSFGLDKAENLLLSLQSHKGSALDWIKKETLRRQDKSVTGELKKSVEAATRGLAAASREYAAYVRAMKQAYARIKEANSQSASQAA